MKKSPSGEEGGSWNMEKGFVSPLRRMVGLGLWEEVPSDQ